MNINLKKSISVLFIFLVIMFISSFAYAAIGLIDKMEGEVSFRDKDNIPYKSAAKGAKLDVNNWIKTGATGWAVLLFNDGTKMTLANNTEFKVASYQVKKTKKEAQFDLFNGKLRAMVTKMPGGKVDYKVKSPTAVAGIRGTEFMMMTEGKANVLFGEEGKVAVSGEKTPTKALTPDTMVQNTRSDTPTNAVKVEPNSPLLQAKKDFEAITSDTPPADWEKSKNLPNIVARWNLNYGHYLADAGKYDEAMSVFQIALDLTNIPEIRADARLERATVYSRFLNNTEAALSEYLIVIEQYPSLPERESALYYVGMLLSDLGQNDRS
ncbi:MAG: FecR domain-containing protein, partial [Nitrospirae bacterium]|nr:FecR domain-containing protein [Nitrospirota bacterium]